MGLSGKMIERTNAWLGTVLAVDATAVRIAAEASRFTLDWRATEGERIIPWSRIDDVRVTWPAPETPPEKDASVELDALPPDVLTDLVAECIEREIDGDAWARAEDVEDLERETLASIVAIDWVPGHHYDLPEAAS